MLDEALATEGFSLVSATVQRDVEAPSYARRTYLNGDRYIEFFVNTHYRDEPVYGNVILGTGTTEWPDGDWNAIALWKLAEAKDPASKAGYLLLRGKTFRWF